MLCLQNITYEDKNRRIIENVNMTFRKGITYSILGPNGAGKSTIAYIIMGAIKPTGGKVLLDERDITELSITERAKLGITLLWQEPARYDGITLEEYLTLGGKLNVSESELRRVFEIVGLPYELYCHRFVDKSLSGGERKRIELASVLLLKPKYAILDEPDSGLDITASDLIDRTLEYLGKVGTTVILITHHEEIAKKTEFSYFVCGGKVVRKGFSEEVVEYYKRVCGKCPLLEGMSDGH
ncbi:ABC transporter ATP-binding protein [Thermococcus sp. M39]|uniref:ATP-binding cassette domain-containing protein n=1 Tax=unclassified Thermococcus TaxID=2627626 RepID=UPI00143A0B0E|nr:MULTISPECIES: ABC transporter ATP-binding protein [unclassified Thermococcus]NJE08517.1 ABC transporter ATP-binding protein [Thermococcus sp. M39]NJE13115.1 ABC transporter ATP-binding protein [Thermococcus sp. LS2]